MSQPVKNAFVRLSLFLLVAQVYYISPVHYITDSGYSLLMDEAILHHGTPNMIFYQVPRGTGLGFINGYSWNIALRKGRLIYQFPWGLPILSLPGVAVANALGYVVAPNHVYSWTNETRLQGVLTSLLSALIVCLVYESAASLLPVSWSLMIALSVAFATQMWSSVSRSLWPQTWYLSLIMMIILLLLRGRLRPASLATLSVWSAFVRPMAAPTLLILSVYILFELESPQACIVYIVTGLVWAAILSVVVLFFIGHLLAPVYNAQQLMAMTGSVNRLIGILFSPARGLLIYVPVVLVPLYLTTRYYRHFPQRRLAVLALAEIFSIIVTLSCCRIWWGGWSYGPRDLVETVPWFALLTILGIKAFLDAPQSKVRERAIFIAAAMLLLTVSVMMNALGALSRPTFDWNASPNIDEHPDRLWDWRHPQFLAWYPPWQEGHRAYLEQRREAAINMEQQMLARGDMKAADRLVVVIRKLDDQLGH